MYFYFWHPLSIYSQLVINANLKKNESGKEVKDGLVKKMALKQRHGVVQEGALRVTGGRQRYRGGRANTESQVEHARCA